MADQSEYWNRVADQKTFTTPFRLATFSELLPKEKIVLDVGCGYGRTLAELADAGYEHLIGLDFSQRLIERGRRLHPNLDLRVMTGNRLEIEDETADAVILLAVLTCVPDDADQIRLIGEIRRVLKPGGVLYVNDFLLNEDERNLKRYAAAPTGRVYGVFRLPEGGILRHHSVEWIERLTQPFETVFMERETFVTMNGHRGNGFCYVGRKLTTAPS